MRVPFFSRPRICGFLEFVDGREVVGWALDRNRPAQPLTIEIMIDDTVIGSTSTALARPDVAQKYGVTGTFGFSFYAWPPIADEDIDRVKARVKDAGGELLSTCVQRVKSETPHPLSDLTINIATLAEVMQAEPAHYKRVRVDPILNCNLHCVYCHHSRTNEVFGVDRLEQVLNRSVLSTEILYIGCVMEPTLDPRLVEVVETIAASPAKPSKTFGLQTNGTLLKNHDISRLVRAGLNQVTISVDTLDDRTLRSLRGVNAKALAGNVSWLRRQQPDLEICFLATVTKANVDQMSDFVRASLALGIRTFTFHEVFHLPESKIVDYDRMQSLLLDEGEFHAMKLKVAQEFSGQAHLNFVYDTFFKGFLPQRGLSRELTVTSRAKAS
jgi:sulfatase maturation enzyme AslB (radical SAM superfamily)